MVDPLRFKEMEWAQMLRTELNSAEPDAPIARVRNTLIRVSTTWFCSGHFDFRTKEFGVEAIEYADQFAKFGRDYAFAWVDNLVVWGYLQRVGEARYRLTLPEDVNQQSLVPAPPAPRPPLQPKLAERRCALYRWRDKQRNLLYIGITFNPEHREVGHAANSLWWTFAARVQIEWFPSRGDAEAAEQQAIREEQPIFNRAHNTTPGSRERAVQYLTLRKRTDLLPAALLAG